MADLTITAANVVKADGAETATETAGEAITAGQTLYRNTDSKLYKAKDDTAAHAAAIGVALGSAVVALLQQGGLDLGGMMDSLGLKRYNRPRPDALWYLACTAASLFVSLAATAKAARTVTSLGVADSLADAA